MKSSQSLCAFTLALGASTIASTPATAVAPMPLLASSTTFAFKVAKL